MFKFCIHIWPIIMSKCVWFCQIKTLLKTNPKLYFIFIVILFYSMKQYRTYIWVVAYDHLYREIVSTWGVFFIGLANFPSMAQDKACQGPTATVYVDADPCPAQWESSAVCTKAMPSQVISRHERGPWIFYFNKDIVCMNCLFHHQEESTGWVAY